jgi:hypothetical protein
MSSDNKFSLATAQSGIDGFCLLIEDLGDEGINKISQLREIK